MTIERFRYEDMPPSKQYGKSGRVSPEGAAIRALQPGEAISFPCRWEHTKSICGAHALIGQIRTRNKVALHSTCKDGVVYVGRPPIDTEGE